MANLTTRWSVKCAVCGAAPGRRCIGSTGRERASVHVERWQRKLAKERKKKALLHQVRRQGRVADEGVT